MISMRVWQIEIMHPGTAYAWYRFDRFHGNVVDILPYKIEYLDNTYELCATVSMHWHVVEHRYTNRHPWNRIYGFLAMYSDKQLQ